MEEELIKMETATMMRGIGFDEKTLYAYQPDGRIYVNVDRFAKAYNSVPVNDICLKFIFGYDCQRDHCRDCGLQVYLLSAPTQALAAKWIRETHDINVSVLRMTDSYGGAVSKENLLRYFWHIQIPKRETMVDVGVYYDSYEEATEAGLIKAIGLIQNKKERNQMKIIVSFSGGKDSQACLIQATKQYGADKIEAVFCDTGWEHPDTYQHITDVCSQMGIKLTTLKSKFDFVSLAVYKKRFPSTKARFCTEELKMKPMIDYVLSLKESCIIIQGIRASESASRAKLEPECMYFKEYFRRVQLVDKKGKVKEKWAQSYRRKEVLEWCKRFDASVSRPIFYKSAQWVIDCILDAGQQPNPLYRKGCSRVGCYPCIMCRQMEVLILMKDEPMKMRLSDAEDKIGRSFFPPDYIPKYACTNGKYPMVKDVFRYINDKNATLDMFEPEDGYACMSMFHGLCE